MGFEELQYIKLTVNNFQILLFVSSTSANASIFNTSRTVVLLLVSFAYSTVQYFEVVGGVVFNVNVFYSSRSNTKSNVNVYSQ